MSNVLIGIIGVILFIGLALAGALFLGPRFQESTNNSKASSAVQAVKQVSDAANMYRVQEGVPVTTNQNTNMLVATRYLKSPPTNVVMQNMNLEPSLRSADGAINDEPAAFVIMAVSGHTGSPSGTDPRICDAINKQANGGSTPSLTAMPGASSPPVGCFRDTTGFASYPGGYLAYARF